MQRADSAKQVESLDMHEVYEKLMETHAAVQQSREVTVRVTHTRGEWRCGSWYGAEWRCGSWYGAASMAHPSPVSHMPPS